MGSRGISRWFGLLRADAVFRRPGGVARERRRAVLPINQCEVNSPSMVPGIATRSPVFSWNVRSCFVAIRRLPAPNRRVGDSPGSFARCVPGIGSISQPMSST